LFDPTRPQGVPWPEPSNTTLYRPALPERYRKLAVPFGVKGAVVVEASPWLEDNQWVLDLAAKDPIIVGVVGDLEPGKPEFAKQLERFHANPLFRGIRHGNLWGRDLSAEIERPEFVAGLKLLAQAGLSLDTANMDPKLIAAVVRVTDRVPELRVVIDHLPQMQKPADPAHMRALGSRPQVYVKISEVLRRIDGQVPTDLSIYRATIGQIVDTFGEDRILFGSDWPNSDQWRPYADVFNVVREYFAGKSRAVAEKYFSKNAVQAYRLRVA
jgi:predicted TIM-barrel fold metal-dependent hydrolase